MGRESEWLPRDRRLRYGVDCGHTWAWARGEECPECGLRAALVAAEAERDKAIVDAAMARTDLQRIADRLMREDEEYAAKTARLAALEEAARAWARYRAIARDPKTGPAAYWANTTVLVEAERTLDAAVAHLAAPPGEGA